MTNQIFHRSIDSLHETVLKTMLGVVSFEAALAIDIMDRNLYERANDCRWWALSDSFKRILTSDHITPSDRDALSHILAYINGLYTVYVNIFVYDRFGIIVAVSNKKYEEYKGMQLQGEAIKNTLGNKDSQKYFVSPFEKSPLYDGEYTYIYNASITNQAGDATVGGIGIVFDAKEQFRAILDDILPSDRSDKSFAIFANRSSHTVIASSNQSIAIGGDLGIEDRFFQLQKGEKYSSIILYNGDYYGVGSSSSCGYREYKNSDGYTNDLVALSFLFLGKEELIDKKPLNTHFSIASYTKENHPIKEFGTFFIGNYWYGFEVEDLDGALGVEGIQKDLDSEVFLGRIFYKDNFVEIVSLHPYLRIDPSCEQQIIIFKDKSSRMIGLMIDALGPICEIPDNMIGDPRGVFSIKESFLRSIAKPPEGINKILSIIDPDALIKVLSSLSE